jgi:hypothetical protein
MNQFSSLDAYDALHAFVVINNYLLKEDLVRRAADVAQEAWSSPLPVSVKTQHEFLFDQDERAGCYRESVLVNRLGAPRDYPRASLIPRLMVRVFTPAYEKAVAGETVHPEASGEEVAWYIGAVLRAIHPFERGNLVLSWIIENQVRRRHGLRLVIPLRSKDEFDLFRQEKFLPLVEKSFG